MRGLAIGSTFSPWTYKYDVKKYGATGNGITDDTTAIQAAMTAIIGAGEILYFPPGTYNTTVAMTCAASNITVKFAPGAKLVLNPDMVQVAIDEAMEGILFTGDNITVEGGEIESPAAWDGTNAEPAGGWKAVIDFQGDRCKVSGMTLTNIYKVGIMMRDHDDLTVEDCHIHGNFPPATFYADTTLSGHFGIFVNPGASGYSGRSNVEENFIDTCVQGCFLGNYDAGSGVGVIVDGNHFTDCWNHGVYNAGGLTGCNVAGNDFTRCGVPIVMTGDYHVVEHNVLYTNTTGNGWDKTGISMRNPRHCNISHNTITGDTANGTLLINLYNLAITPVGTEVSDNIVSHNNIFLTSTGEACVIQVGDIAQTSICDRNVIDHNTISAPGRVGYGLIAFRAAPGAYAVGNKITGNTLKIMGESHGISLNNVQHATVQNNSIQFAWDAPSAKTLVGIRLSASTYCKVSGNDIFCLADYGTNVTIDGILEYTGCSENWLTNNNQHYDPTKLSTRFVPITVLAGSNIHINESGPGVPALRACPGSMWRDTAGSTSTTLYIKETAETSTTWRAV